MAEFEPPEKPESERERTVGLIIAVIAVVLAIVSSVAHDTHNDEILAHVDAADQYAFYQAKKERHAQLELALDSAQVAYDRLSPAAQVLSDKFRQSYLTEEKKLDSDSKKIQAQGDTLMAESRQLEHKAGVLDLGEIALQISVVLCSISILTDQALFLRMGIVVAVVGVLFALWGGLLPR